MAVSPERSLSRVSQLFEVGVKLMSRTIHVQYRQHERSGPIHVRRSFHAGQDAQDPAIRKSDRAVSTRAS